MMTYAELCKTKCEGCRQGIPLNGGRTHHKTSPWIYHWEPCTAPTSDQFERELQQEIEQLEEHAAALSQKLDTLSAPLSTCGCSYDSPAHVCMVHSPQLVAANKRISELERENARLSRAVNDWRNAAFRWMPEAQYRDTYAAIQSAGEQNNA